MWIRWRIVFGLGRYAQCEQLFWADFPASRAVALETTLSWYLLILSASANDSRDRDISASNRKYIFVCIMLSLCLPTWQRRNREVKEEHLQPHLAKWLLGLASSTEREKCCLFTSFQRRHADNMIHGASFLCLPVFTANSCDKWKIHSRLLPGADERPRIVVGNCANGMISPTCYEWPLPLAFLVHAGFTHCCCRVWIRVQWRTYSA